MPAFILGYAYMATLTRLIRSSMLEALTQDCVRTARAKGLAERTVVLGHALRNALLPVSPNDATAKEETDMGTKNLGGKVEAF